MRIRDFLLLAAALAPAPLAAQGPGPAVGAGIGMTQSDAVSGSALHVQASAPLLRPFEGVQIRGEALLQGGSANGSPFACEQVRQQYCLGRTDENRIAGAGAYVRVDFGGIGPVRAYLTPIGVGVYHRRTKSVEAQGPTGICAGPDGITSCPDNPPFESFVQEHSVTSVGWTTGGGLELSLGRVRAFAEVRVHDLLEDDGMAGALPLTFGISL